MAVLVVIEEPTKKKYSKLFKEVLLKVPTDLDVLDVQVTAHVPTSSVLNFVLLSLYSQLRTLAIEKGFPYSLGINVLFNVSGMLNLNMYEAIYSAESEQVHGLEGLSVQTEIFSANIDDENGVKFQESRVSAVGGTFDHLHDAHKILLSMTAFTTSELVIVGVTGPELLKNKKYAEVLDSLWKRVSNVSTFLQRVLGARTSFQIYQINDVCGPTGYLPNIDNLVISQETVKGAQFVNDHRKRIGFKSLNVITVEVIGGDETTTEANGWKGKLSSTDLREIDWKKLHGNAQ